MKARPFPTCAAASQEASKPLRKGDSTNASRPPVYVMEELRVPIATKSFGVSDEAEVEQCRMQRDDAFAHNRLQTLVGSADERSASDAYARESIDATDIGRIKLADFVQAHSAVDSNKRHPDRAFLGRSAPGASHPPRHPRSRYRRVR